MPLMATVDYAIYYRELGFSVIPLKQDKSPYLNWREFQNRRASISEVKTWWKDWPDANIGVVTGRISGLVVLDVDKEGMKKRKLWDIFNTPIAITGGGGRHLYFKHPNDKAISNFQARPDLKGIDLRGDGGYVVAPPSKHKSGKEYTWEKGYEIDTINLCEFPEEVFSATPAKADPIKNLYGGVKAGGRNQALARLAGSWVADGLSLDECLGMAEVWNSKNDPPLGEHEIATTVKSIYAKHYAKYDEFNISALQLGSELKKLTCKVEWYVEGLIPKDSLVLLSGRGGIGKTWLCLQLANAVAKGKPFMGITTTKTNVVYIDYENALPVLVERIRILSADPVNFWHTTNEVASPPRLDSSDYEIFKQLPKGILVVDTLRASHLKDENESKDMAVIMNRLKEIRDAGFTVIVLHHTSKANNKAAKGSTAIADLADQTLALSEVPHIINYRGGKKDPHQCWCRDTHFEGEEEPEMVIIRFGTHSKTRYYPFHTFLRFEGSIGFAPIKEKWLLDSLHKFGREL